VEAIDRVSASGRGANHRDRRGMEDTDEPSWMGRPVLGRMEAGGQAFGEAVRRGLPGSLDEEVPCRSIVTVEVPNANSSSKFRRLLHE
jgi:hypothetical protein